MINNHTKIIQSTFIVLISIRVSYSNYTNTGMRHGKPKA
jgi:hypothetical protein